MDVAVLEELVVVLPDLSVQLAPVYPLLQVHSPGCVHLPLVGAIKKERLSFLMSSLY